MGAGYNEELKIHYDEFYQFGNTRIYIVAPKISEEENQKRWERVNEVANRIVQEIIARGNQSEIDKLMKRA